MGTALWFASLIDVLTLFRLTKVENAGVTTWTLERR